MVVSLVVPCYNEADVLPLLRGRIEKTVCEIEAMDLDVELLLVDDGSSDGTWELIVELARADPRVRGVSLSRNFGHQTALTCGYDMACGDAVVSMDADLQDPPEVVDQMVTKWQAGADIVYGVRTARKGETPLKLWTASLFYWAVAKLGIRSIQPSSGDFRLLSRRALEALRKMGECHRFVRGMVGWIGFKTDAVHFVRDDRKAGVTKYPLRKMLLLATDAIVSFTSVPLRLAYIGAGLLNLVFLGYVFYIAYKCLSGTAALQPGWLSLILAVIFFGTTNLLCVGIIGEYLGRTYEQAKGRPHYFVMEDTRPEGGNDAPTRQGV